MSTKKIFFWITAIIVLIILMVIVSTAFYTVNEAEYACVLRFEQVITTTSSPGLHMKAPFIDRVIYFPKMKLLYDLKPSEVLTLDSEAMSVDSLIVWRIVDPLQFYKAVNSIINAQSRLDNAAYNELKKVIGTLQQKKLISTADDTSRNYLNDTVLENIKIATESYGIEVLDVKIKRFDLPVENEQAVYRRMISDRNKIAELYHAEGEKEASKIHNDVDKRVNIIKSNAALRAEQIIAEGEAEYMRILAEAYNIPEKSEFYIFLRGLDAIEKSLKGENKTVILDSDSELTKILNGIK